jgi:hypothetical protein
MGSKALKSGSHEAGSRATGEGSSDQRQEGNDRGNSARLRREGNPLKGEPCTRLWGETNPRGRRWSKPSRAGGTPRTEHSGMLGMRPRSVDTFSSCREEGSRTPRKASSRKSGRPSGRLGESGGGPGVSNSEEGVKLVGVGTHRTNGGGRQPESGHRRRARKRSSAEVATGQPNGPGIWLQRGLRGAANLMRGRLWTR